MKRIYWWHNRSSSSVPCVVLEHGETREAWLGKEVRAASDGHIRGVVVAIKDNRVGIDTGPDRWGHTYIKWVLDASIIAVRGVEGCESSFPDA